MRNILPPFRAPFVLFVLGIALLSIIVAAWAPSWAPVPGYAIVLGAAASLIVFFGFWAYYRKMSLGDNELPTQSPRDTDTGPTKAPSNTVVDV